MVLVEAGPRCWNVRFVQALGVVFAAAMLFLAATSIAAMRAEGTEELAPLWQRLLMGTSLLLLGAIVLAGSLMYALRYVARMERHGDILHICTLGPFRRHCFDVPTRKVRIGRRFAPVVRGRGQYVDAPGMLAHIEGRRFPFVVDLKSELIDQRALGKINHQND